MNYSANFSLAIPPSLLLIKGFWLWSEVNLPGNWPLWRQQQDRAEKSVASWRSKKNFSGLWLRWRLSFWRLPPSPQPTDHYRSLKRLSAAAAARRVQFGKTGRGGGAEFNMKYAVQKHILSWKDLRAKQLHYLNSPTIYIYYVKMKFRRILHFFSKRTHTRRSSFWKFFFLRSLLLITFLFILWRKKDATSQQQQQQQQHAREAALQQRRHRSCFCSVVANQPNSVLRCNMRHSNSELVQMLQKRKYGKKATMF